MTSNVNFFTQSSVHILALGDIMLDRYIYGDVERISPEAPVPVFHSKKVHYSLGGVGNVIRNLMDLQAKSTVIAMCGPDRKGDELKALLENHSRINVNLMSYGTTICKTRYVSSGQQLMRVDEEANMPLPNDLVEHLIQQLSLTIQTFDIVILSDYAKGFLTPELCQKVIELAKAHHIPVLVDPKGNDYRKYQGCTIITPNLKELSDVSGKKLTNDSEIVTAAKSLMAEFNLDHVLVTRSAEGMTLVSYQGEYHHLPTNAREVFDVSGAGDTVVATLAIAIAKGLDLVSACQLANTAAGIVVGKAGTATIHLEELEKAFTNGCNVRSKQKIYPLTQAADLIQTWRHQGLKVGFTNGCFDLLHSGHVHSLESAKAKCDRLIVGLNSDASIKRLKGKARPIQGEDVRSLVLSALEVVDMVIIFDDDTPLSLIETLMPDVLFKGKDYTIETVVGADIVQKNGGHVELISLIPGFSTSNIIEKMEQKSS
jgi:D-beta-D-heptose 7-phosphate kinase/D-beta-D-heptose 1-phosphate adenosyltransferase